MAIEQGDAASHYNLALMYANGEGLPQDYQQSFDLLRKAADQGLADAEWQLGNLYESGYGVAQDYEAARACYLRAAEQGITKALGNLASLYEEGISVPCNLVTSYMLFSLAEDKNEPDSIDERTRVAGLLTPEEIEEGNALASQWKVGMPLPS
jgi:hypothetical protein